jgi:hypothetical protein
MKILGFACFLVMSGCSNAHVGGMQPVFVVVQFVVRSGVR